MSEILKSFSIVPNEEDEAKAYMHKIARICHLPASEIDTDDLVDFMLPQLGIGSPFSNMKLVSRMPIKGLKDQVTTLRLLSEEVLEMSALNRSYGSFLPSYVKLLEQHQASGGASDGHHSLLLGALSQASIREHAITVRMIFPQVKCYSLDLSERADNESTRGMSAFVRGDGRALPFFNSLGTIHTNFLLDMLEGENGLVPASEAAHVRQQIFASAYVALRDNGALLMVENMESTKAQFSFDELAAELQNVGFQHITSMPAERFRRRIDLARFMQGTTSEIAQGLIRPVPYYSAIYAGK